MRTNIEIEDKLLAKAMRVGKLSTKRATVDAALQLFVRMHDQKRILRHFGKVDWIGDLDQMRQGRSSKNSAHR